MTRIPRTSHTRFGPLSSIRTARLRRSTPAIRGRRLRSLPTSKQSPLPRTDHIVPPELPLTAAERAVIAAHRTPIAVQRWLNALPYNTEKHGETLRGFRGVVRTGTAHCL